MKNLLTAILPALALLALGGCAGTAALATSEDDGVYYSSHDRTAAVVSAAPAPTSTNEAANPDYNGSTASAPARPGRNADQYYDNTYTYMRGVPSYGVTSYSPYSPYTTLSYGVSSYYGGAYGFAPYPCVVGYDPFFSPFAYGYGPSVSLSFGYGRPWGYGGYSSYYGRPYGYGYGGGFYDPYYYSSPYYGGYYGRGGYYGNNSYGGGYYGNNYGTGGNYSGGVDNTRYRTSGHRDDRASDGRYSTSGGGAAPNSTPGGGRVRSERVMAPAGAESQPMPAAGGNEGSRIRAEGVTAMPVTQPRRGEESYNQPRRMDGEDQPRYRNMEQQPGVEPGADQRQAERGRWRRTDDQPQSGQAQPQEGQRRRGGFFQNVFTEPAPTGGQATDQPRRRSVYDQPREQRSFEQPQQRSYEQPQQRSYEQPQQRSYSQPSYSAPSNGGGGGGGGHSRGRTD